MHLSCFTKRLCILVLLLACGSLRAATNEHGFVVTVHPLATDAAIAAMKRGGNAVDAIVAAGITLGVVDGHNSGIGGGCFLVIRRANGEVVAIDGRETAPAAATRDMFLRNGKAVAELSETGPLASGVPGEVAAFHHAVTKFGKLPWREHCLAAAKIAEEGFVLERTGANRLKEAAKDLAKFPASRAVLLHADGSPLTVGETLRQPDLAKSLRALGEQGPDWFYKGPFARATADWMKASGGLITETDFADYKAKMREPLRTMYRGHEIIGFPPPSSGGVHVAQILNILEHFDLRAMGENSPDFVHVVTEAMKLAFADRAFWLGDPDFVSVPRGLVSRDYAATLAKKIDVKKTTPVPQHNTPSDAAGDLFGKHTTHFSAADAEGNWVGCTATVNTTFGSKVIVPGTGVVLNNQMDDFSAQPGMANYFGLVGAEANAVAPGKRPLSSMSPTIVLKDGRPILSVGAAGGPTIISQTLLTIIRVVDFDRSPADALAQPHFHHQWRPDELRIEKQFPTEIRRELQRRGHKLKEVESFGACQAVGRDATGLTGAHDPRVTNGKAAGW
ncbi:MAG: gamma-glutamyltransferase [Verrucomicrobia bacterium]|nr:gamma-glutamyltransferase [Verrucomicrobiota bacterium]